MADGQALARPEGKPQDSVNAAHVYQAIGSVMADLAREGISKDLKNDQQGYKFRGIDDVYNALSATLSRNHLCVIPHMLSRKVSERQTKSNSVLYSVTVSADFDFVSALDGSTHKVGPFYGEAMDSGDKATNKAMSAAYKYMALQTFCIPTEGDNDADATTPQETVSTQRKSAYILRKEDVWPKLMKALKLVEKEEEFADFDEANADLIAKFPVAWKESLEEEKDKHREALKEQADVAREARRHV